MISNQVLQNTLEGSGRYPGRSFVLLIQMARHWRPPTVNLRFSHRIFQAFVESQAASQLVKGYQYFKVCDDYQLEYILVAHGEDEDTYIGRKACRFPDPEPDRCI